MPPPTTAPPAAEPSRPPCSPPPPPPRSPPRSPPPRAPDADTKPDTISGAIRKDLLGTGAAHFSDVVLVARDGARVPAVRALLAVRSPYFRARLFANYADKSEKVLAIPEASSLALQQIVEYAYTDGCDLVTRATAALHSVRTQPYGFYPTIGRKRRKAAPNTAPAKPPADLASVGLGAVDIIHLIELLLAADYLQLASLAKRVTSLLVNMISEIPSVTCVVMETAGRQPALEMIAPQIMVAVWKKMRTAPHDCLLVEDFRISLRNAKGHTMPAPRLNRKRDADCGVLMLQPSTFEKILMDDDLFTSETYLLQVLYFWATDGVSLGSLRPRKALVLEKAKPNEESNSKEETPSPGKKTKSLLGKRKADEVIRAPDTIPPAPEKRPPVQVADEERWKLAREMVHHIQLERLKPSFVRDYLEPSGLVDREQILTIYQQQALEAERGRALYDSFRGGSTWDNQSKILTEFSAGYKTRLLGGPWVKSGRHEWTFRIGKDSDCTWIGITGSESHPNDFFGQGRLGWAFGSQGSCTQNGMIQRRKGPSMTPGKTVKMMLNLTRGGTLTMILEGQDKSFRAFSELKKGGGRQFKPAVYLKRPAVVTLVHEKHTME
ncbi:unnamed protein product [Chondrus crispus]|uniref:BTB domain-containing protein n=1 Tax=Chondrus crispus TaxID=2769 RepID=R7QCD4_CHOCR|nr:unnamed protein product [Chondrus crispus]CDF36167.1 unnamed protein product [Chondrus crispus]|eukprot:XP_005715986.1 unnamed protein product [Chondrus crispus]